MANKLIKEVRQSDIFSHIFDFNYLPRWCVLLMDCVLCVIAFLLSYWIGSGVFRYNMDFEMLPIMYQFLILLCVQVFFFYLFHTYSGILRYSTFVDTIKCLLAIACTGILILLLSLSVDHFAHYKLFYNTVPALYVPIAFVLLFCLRVGVKTIYEAISQTLSDSPKALIYGTTSSGLAIAKMLHSMDKAPYRIVGFAETPDNKTSYRLAGLHVFPLNQKTMDYMHTRGIRYVIFATANLGSSIPAKDLQILIKNNIHILTTTNFNLYDEDTSEEQKQHLLRINSIQIEDLLERPTIAIDTDNVLSTIQDKIVLVSGAAGSIGSELVRQIQKFKPRITVLVEQAESPLHDLTLDLHNEFPNANFVPLIADVRNRKRIETIFSEYKPDIIYHAAAYKHVPLMESHPNEAIQANVMGTRNMADLAVKYKAERFIMISTDKAVNPTNIMGASKRIAEIYVQSLFKKLQQDNPNCTKFITTRFGNVLGSNGSVIPYFKKQIAAGGPVTVTHPDIIRYFMTIPEACCLVMEASALGNGGEIFVFDMGHPVKILNLAKNMIRLAGYIPGEDMQIVFTGLRPGEKLFEELLNKKETTLPTSNKKILIAKVREYDYEQVQQDITELVHLAELNKPFLAVKKMKEIVPEFKSKNSIYEELDI